MAKRSREEDFEEAPSSLNSEILGTSSQSETPDIENTSDSITSKIIHLEPASSEVPSVMRCSLPGHHLTFSFSSYDDHEVHYKKFHLHRCLECRKNFPTEHFLNLHIEENHDAFVSVRKDKGEKIYSCFVEDCERKCSTPQKRRMHLIDKHMFPQQYDFFVVNYGIDHRSSMLRSGRQYGRRRSSAAHSKLEDARQRSAAAQASSETPRLEKSESSDGDIAAESQESSNQQDFENTDSSRCASSPTTNGNDMEGLENAMSALKFVPTSVRFGRGRGRGGFSRT